jgi:hypothetical protein
MLWRNLRVNAPVSSVDVVFLNPCTGRLYRGRARDFTYLYEAITSALGDVELENMVTWHAVAIPECVSTKSISGTNLKLELPTDRNSVYHPGLAHRSDKNNKFSYDDGAVD